MQEMKEIFGELRESAIIEAEKWAASKIDVASKVQRWNLKAEVAVNSRYTKKNLSFHVIAGGVESEKFHVENKRGEYENRKITVRLTESGDEYRLQVTYMYEDNLNRTWRDGYKKFDRTFKKDGLDKELVKAKKLAENLVSKL